MKADTELNRNTAQFIARVTQNLPPMTGVQMQRFNDDPLLLQRVLRKSLCPVMYIDVTTNGRSVDQCVVNLKEQGYLIPPEIQSLDELTENSYRLAIIRGDVLQLSQRQNQNIRDEAEIHGYRTPPAGLAPFVRETVTNEHLKQLGLSALIVMHEPIWRERFPLLLGISQGPFNVCRWFDRGFQTYFGNPERRWMRGRRIGFAFLDAPKRVVKRK